MNSAAELKRHNESQAFAQAKDKIVTAIQRDPLGLSINQIMTVCKLSVKTVKTILQDQCFESDNGVYFLKDKTRTLPELSTQPQKITTKIEKVTKPEDKVEKMVKPDTTPLMRPKSYAESMNDMFRYNPDGVTLDEALRILGGDRQKFDSRLCTFKKTKYMIQLKVCPDGVKRYVPLPNNVPAKVENPQIDKPQNDWTKFCDIKPNNISEVTKLKENITTVTTTKSELSISSDQLNILLTDLFGLSNINWFVEGGHITGVQLSEVVSS